MKKQIEVDEQLLATAKKSFPQKTDGEIVEVALQKIISYTQAVSELLKLKGKVKWEGNLDEMRTW